MNQLKQWMLVILAFSVGIFAGCLAMYTAHLSTQQIINGTANEYFIIAYSDTILCGIAMVLCQILLHKWDTKL